MRFNYKYLCGSTYIYYNIVVIFLTLYSFTTCKGADGLVQSVKIQNKDPTGWEPWERKWAELYDKPIPEEIASKCFPNICHICSKQFTNLSCARDHYLGKCHNNNVENLLKVWAKQNKNTAPKKIFNKHPSAPSGWETQWAEFYDKPIPPEILSKCLPNICQICSKGLGFPHAAKSHYLGQFHDGKVKSLLKDLAKQNENYEVPKKIRKYYVPSAPIENISHSETSKPEDDANLILDESGNPIGYISLN